MQDGFLERHVPTIRSLYKAQRDAMLQALAQHFPDAQKSPDTNLTWNTPAGGMFLWARLPAGMNAVDLLPRAVKHGVAFVPGAPFFAGEPDMRSMRLSFVTPSVEEIHRGVAALAASIREKQS
jgi:2-aminoadipate transaminase